MKKLNVAVIGCGRISVMHFGAIENLEMANLVACCDIKEDRAKKYGEKYNVPYYTNYEEMLSNEKIDAVNICLPHYLHCKVANYAISKGIKVLTEKPMDIDYETAKNTVEYAKEKGVLFGVISQCRYNNSAVLVKNALKQGKLGKILTARSILTWSRSDSYYSQSDWKGTWDKEGGGVLIDQAIHSVDLVNWMIDSEVEKISCHMANRGHSIIKVEDTCEAFIEYKNGAKYAVYCMNNYASDEPIEIKLFCEKGKVVFDYDDAYIYYNDGTTEEAHQDVVEYCEEGMDYWGFQHLKQLKQFYNACLGLEKLDLSGEEALKTHKIIMDMYAVGGMKKWN